MSTSTIDKIISKALSTSSEEEAMTALRLARKKYTGGSIKTEPTRESVNGATDWQVKAREYYKYALEAKHRNDKLLAERDHYYKIAKEYHSKFMDQKAENLDMKQTMQRYRNDPTRLNYVFWKVGFTVSSAITVVTLILFGSIQ